jgi:hypothetical protein
MRIGRFVLSMAIIMLASSTALAQSVVYGMGNVSCGTYSGFRSQDPAMYSAAQTWTTGYLTAMAQQLRIPDLLGGTDLAGASGWLDNYCAQNPVELYYTANYQLVLLLGRRQVGK